MKMLKIISQINPLLRAQSVCKACGAEFTCGATLKGCWCSEIKLSEETRARLRENYKGCLCRACLERFELDEALAIPPAENNLGTSR